MAEPKVVVTFRTTTQAMAWERACKGQNLPGRLIPMPTTISAQCGLAWLIAPAEKASVVECMQELGLEYDQVVEL